MTETDIRVQLAKKLGWRYHEPKPPWAGYWSDPIGNPTELPSLYDLCQEGEELLTKEQEKDYACEYIRQITGRYLVGGPMSNACAELHPSVIFKLIRLSNLPERAKALIEVLP